MLIDTNLGMDLDAWDAFSPETAAERLRGVQTLWYVAAGWALDLFRGGQTREHEDLEIAVPAAAWPEIHERFADLQFFAPYDKAVHELTPETLDATHQTWAWDAPAGMWRLDVFREPHDGGTWICRRDETIRLPYAEIIETTAGGIPYLAPEYALLFKAKSVREKDVADFHGVLPLLDQARRDRLTALISRVHPGHAWLDEIAAA